VQKVWTTEAATGQAAFDLPAVRRKKLTVDFEGGNQSSNGGALLLRKKFFKRIPDYWSKQ
jgi:hypothetical protein